jgi:hypothetical protein
MLKIDTFMEGGHQFQAVHGILETQFEIELATEAIGYIDDQGRPLERGDKVDWMTRVDVPVIEDGSVLPLHLVLVEA